MKWANRRSNIEFSTLSKHPLLVSTNKFTFNIWYKKLDKKRVFNLWMVTFNSILLICAVITVVNNSVRFSKPNIWPFQNLNWCDKFCILAYWSLWNKWVINYVKKVPIVINLQHTCEQTRVAKNIVVWVEHLEKNGMNILPLSILNA